MSAVTTDAVAVIAPGTVERIRMHLSEVSGHTREGLHHAKCAGELLSLSKAKLPHGSWLPWIAENFDLSARTAQRFMKLAERWPELEREAAAKNDTVSHLSWNAALAYLTEPRAIEHEPPVVEPPVVEPALIESPAPIEPPVDEPGVEEPAPSVSKPEPAKPRPKSKRTKPKPAQPKAEADNDLLQVLLARRVAATHKRYVAQAELLDKPDRVVEVRRLIIELGLAPEDLSVQSVERAPEPRPRSAVTDAEIEAAALGIGFAEAYALAAMKAAAPPPKSGIELREKLPRFDQAQRSWLNARFGRAVRAVVRRIVDKRLDAEVLAERERIAAERTELEDLAKTIRKQDESLVMLMTEEEFVRLRNCIAPDKPDRTKDQLTAAAQTLNRIATLTRNYRRQLAKTKDGREVLREHGWAAPEKPKSNGAGAAP